LLNKRLAEWAKDVGVLVSGPAFAIAPKDREKRALVLPFSV
jgi:hypothetical protein